MNNEAPKELTHGELMRHVGELAAAFDPDDPSTIEHWSSICNRWDCGPHRFNDPLWLYRVKPRPRVWWFNDYGGGTWGVL